VSEVVAGATKRLIDPETHVSAARIVFMVGETNVGIDLMSMENRRSTVNDPTSGIKLGLSAEVTAILAAVDALPPSAPTACIGWDAHHVAAHLAAGSKETADLIEESVSGQPSRPTRGFQEREAPFRALSHDKLLLSLGTEIERKVAALAALAQRENPSIDYTGTRVSVVEFTTHSRSEAAIHRWDLLGYDDIGTEMLAAPDLTTHAVKMLNRMQILNESARAIGQRASQVDTAPVRIVFRSPDRPDIVLIASADGSRFELAEGIVDGDVTLKTDPANRLLVLWGRKSANRSIELDGDPDIIAALDTVLWPDAQPWPHTVTT
jgi:uncharacterized protein (TIGR03083 family)